MTREISSNNNPKETIKGKKLPYLQYEKKLTFLFSHVPDKEMAETTSSTPEVLYITQS